MKFQDIRIIGADGRGRGGQKVRIRTERQRGFFVAEDSPTFETDSEGNVRFLLEDRRIAGVWVNGAKMLDRGDILTDGETIKLTI
jgi:hypothetical protein